MRGGIKAPDWGHVAFLEGLIFGVLVFANRLRLIEVVICNEPR